jgi:DNA-binding NarL/FixJ family response regulator
MSRLGHTASEDVTGDTAGDKRRQVVLLDGKQWSYVQSRYSLTARERQIAELVCEGLRNGNIAKNLDIQPGTVKTHIRNIYRKTQVKSKIAMLLKFVTDAQEICDQCRDVRSAGAAD